jgi:hypothetical protein
VNRLSQALEIAEQVADLYGDIVRWRSDFERFRESNGILTSLRLSLLNQSLWNEFKQRCDPKFIEDFFDSKLGI